MCGIFFAYHRKPHCIEAEKINLVLEELRKRGPDASSCRLYDFGFKPSGLDTSHSLLLHTRLAIIDTHDRANQPMHDAGLDLTISYNGEIYNFMEIKAELLRKGYRFSTSSDTEVILKGYREYGSGIFDIINGMWALILLDHRKKKVIVSRDRLGIKPIYFFKSRDCLIISSTVRAVEVYLKENLSLNKLSLFSFVTMGLSDFSSHSFIEGVEAFPANSHCTYNVDSSSIMANYELLGHADGTPIDGTLENHIRDSVRLRLRSDAPTVSLLSSGTDSSLITQFAFEQAEKELRTNYKGCLTYHYKNSSEFDEYYLASEFFNKLNIGEKYCHYSCESEEDVTEKDFANILLDMDGPSSTPSVLALDRTYAHMKEIGLKVALLGDGADEIFGGYDKVYHPQYGVDLLKQMNIKQAFLFQKRHQIGSNAIFKKLFWHLSSGLISRATRAMDIGCSVLRKEFFEDHKIQYSIKKKLETVSVEERCLLDLHTYNLPMILRWVDRISMRHGVEARLPFLDYRIVSAGTSCPYGGKIGEYGGKRPLREVLDAIGSNAIGRRRKAVGFGHQEQFNFSLINFDEMMDHISSNLNDIFDVHAISRLRKQNKHKAWFLFLYLLWSKHR